MPLPELFLHRLQRIIPPTTWEHTLTTFQELPPTAFRILTFKSSQADILSELAAQGITYQSLPWCPEAYLIPAHQRSLLLATTPCQEGKIYVQNPGSLIPVNILDPQPGERILDLAAAPGGKTLHIASRLAGQGQIIAVEAVRDRFFKLRGNLQRTQAQAVETYLMDGIQAGRRWPASFDRVLLDAPCSTESRFHEQDPASYRYWSVRKIREMAHKQVGLLESAFQAVRPGGVLVYCTCSFAPEENEAVVNTLLRHHGPDLAVSPIVSDSLAPVQPGLTAWEKQGFDPQLRHALRLLPTSEREGFFICRLIKAGPTNTPAPSEPTGN